MDITCGELIEHLSTFDKSKVVRLDTKVGGKHRWKFSKRGCKESASHGDSTKHKTVRR